MVRHRKYPYPSLAINGHNMRKQKKENGKNCNESEKQNYKQKAKGNILVGLMSTDPTIPSPTIPYLITLNSTTSCTTNLNRKTSIRLQSMPSKSSTSASSMTWMHSTSSGATPHLIALPIFSLIAFLIILLISPPITLPIALPIPISTTTLIIPPVIAIITMISLSISSHA
ncbi:hypothetical protein HOY80DRAFT_1005635 [Tuber brumale]|nr:hypothetical protein HOY80DRAFT_1005635 [Tuber brumale]